MAAGAAPALSHLCALHYASTIGNGRVPPVLVPLPTHIGDEILSAMRELNVLNETSIRNFAKTPLEITRFNVSGCDEFTLDALRSLLRYNTLISINLSESERTGSSFSINSFIKECLSPSSCESLRHLNIGGYTNIYGVSALERLTNLESICFSRRPICQKWIANAIQPLKNLKSIDISETRVTDLDWLPEFENLEVLLMYNVKIRQGDVQTPLLALKKLKVLDVSKKVTDFASDGSQESYADLPAAIVNSLRKKEECCWPQLLSLDMSGNALAGMGLDQAIRMVDTVIEKCPQIKRISVLATPLDGHAYSMDEGQSVDVVNCATRTNAVRALQIYWDTERDVFTSHALHAVYYCLQSSYDQFSEQEVVECASLVCSAMKRHLGNIGVQMAGSACLYHLCKMKRICRLSAVLVQNCMNRCLDAAEAYRQMVQLQKNVWLTICNDYLLQLPGVDFYRTCKVALESMLTSRDSSVARMTIAIVSIVTPKMRPPEARELTGDERYVKYLVNMLNENLKVLNNSTVPRPETSLFTLKFTLSALWNLTDESAATCEIFDQAGGVVTCFEILRSFEDHYNIQTKVLGILNNIAEVSVLRDKLVNTPNYLIILCKCLEGNFTERDENGRNRAVERSYFAAGVLANLLVSCDWVEHVPVVSKEFVNNQLTAAVKSWPELRGAMVSYRSFAPFVRILGETSFSGAQMWCLWGVLHVLSHRDKASGISYTSMLQNSEVPRICSTLSRTAGVENYVRDLAHRIEMFLSLEEKPEETCIHQ